MKRERWIDNSRCIAICLVVIGHSIGYLISSSVSIWSGYHVLFSLIYCFHMPLFFFISAYLQKQKENYRGAVYSWTEIKAKICEIVIPYVFFSFIYWFSKRIMSMNVNNKVSIKDLLLIPIVPLSTLWFIYALLVFWLLRVLTVRMKISTSVLLVSTFILSILSYHFSYSEFIDKTALPRIIQNSVYYAAGLLFADMRYEKKWNMPSVFICSALSFLTLFILKTNISVLQKSGIMAVLIAFCGIVSTCSISSFLEGKAMQEIGKRTLSVYLMHDYFVVMVVLIGSRLNLNVNAVLFLSVLISVSMPIAIYELCKKNKWTSYIFNPKFIRKGNHNEH